jgi:hypothetical protein
LEKITYILGAGASAKALPIIRNGNNDKNFSDALIEFIIRCEKGYENYFQEPHVVQFRIDINWLAKECIEFSTPDTFAKYLYHTDKKSLKRLKAALIGFFVIEQTLFNKVDKRPIAFITSLMEDSGQLPENVGFISWNYDYQMQIAFSKYRQEELISRGGIDVHRPPLTEYFPRLGHPHHFDQPFKLVQLNGIAGLHYDHLLNKNLNFDLTSNNPSDFSRLLKLIYERAESETMLFTFAWEKLNNSNTGNVLYQKMNHALKIAEDTTILVIIGYSFPFFNRKVDNEIFKKMLESGKLKKIYLQDPINNGEFLMSQFNIPKIRNGVINPILIEHIANVSSYYIPYEM